MEINFGQYAAPVILAVLLGIVYKVIPTIPDSYKSLIAIAFGLILGLVYIPYATIPWSVTSVVDYGLAGFMMGASAVGLYEGLRSVKNPRE
jgi:uncharacterized membrane protein YadS